MECSGGLPSCIQTETSQCESEQKVQGNTSSGVVKHELEAQTKETVVGGGVQLSNPKPEGLTLTTKLGANQDSQ